MKVMIASYNEAGETWNAEAQETGAYAYKLDHQFDEPCEVWVYIRDDKSGTKAQKYNADANDNYLGTSRITIEDPTGTDIFFGRIVKAEARTDNTVLLYCRDWLDQLDDTTIDYDFREDLDGSGLRESSLLPDWDDTDGNGIRAAFDAGGGTIYLYDNNRILTADAHNGQYLCFSNKIAGTKTWSIGPQSETVTAAAGIDNDSGSVADLWDDDNANAHATWDNDEDWTVDYTFQIGLGDETDTFNNNYVADSLTAAYVRVSYSFRSTADDAVCDIQIKVDDDNDGILESFKTIGQLEHYDSDLGTIIQRDKVFQIPEEFFNGTTYDAIVNTGGDAIVRFNVNWISNTAYLYIYKIELVVTCSTTGMTDIASISDGETYRLTVDIDFADPTKKVWSGCQYSIAREIYKHIDSAESPGTFITDGDALQVLTCAATIEHTSGISFKKYVDKSRLQILRDLARQDKAHFWITNGGSTLNWKSTFNDAPVDETLTDSEVLSLQMVQDYYRLYNRVTVYGMRIAEQQLSNTQSDATSIDTFNITRDKIVTGGMGLVSDYDCKQRATAELNRHKDMQKLVPQCTLRGNTLTAAHANTIKLGDEITLNSSYLGVNAAYIVQRVIYDSKTHITTLYLHPRLSQTGIQPIEQQSAERAFASYRRGTPETYIPQNTSEEL